SGLWIRPSCRLVRFLRKYIRNGGGKVQTPIAAVPPGPESPAAPVPPGPHAITIPLSAGRKRIHARNAGSTENQEVTMHFCGLPRIGCADMNSDHAGSRDV